MSSLRHTWRRDAATLGVLLCVGALLAACTPPSSSDPFADENSTIVRYKPFFAGLDGATFGTQPVLTGNDRVRLPNRLQGDGSLVTRGADGSRVVNSPSVQALMAAIEILLDEGEDKLLLDQLVSIQAKDHFRSEGREPIEVVDYLLDHRRDLAVLFARMPFGERSPTVKMRKSGKNTFLIELSGQARRGSNFTKLWVALEAGKWKFVWAS